MIGIAALQTASMPFEMPRNTKKMFSAATKKKVQTIGCTPSVNSAPLAALPVTSAKKSRVTCACVSTGVVGSMPMPPVRYWST